MRILAIILTYHPQLASLRELCTAVLPQTDGTLIVDNGSQWDPQALVGAIDIAQRTRLEFLWLRVNVGVAAGHNQGIAWAREHGFSHVLLMDQDSIPAPDMVKGLFNALVGPSQGGVRVAAVGPQHIDAYTGNVAPFVRFGRFALKRVNCPAGQPGNIIETDFLMTSGSLIPMSVLAEVGLMNEGLFIDHVDTEWVLRARSLGYKTFGVCNAIMRHSLGDATLGFWFLRWRNIPLHSPDRHYYIFRNSLILYNRPYAPWRWIVNDLVRLVYMAVFYPVFAPHRVQRIRSMLKGIWHGLHGVQGPHRKVLRERNGAG